MYHTTGFDHEEVIDLCIRINSVEREAGAPIWPSCLGLFKSVVAALTYLRHNRTQAEIGESLGVSQPTISRAISAITPLIPEATREFVPTADDLDPDAQYILDGTLLPCWSWAGQKELYSGKHKTTGMNAQVACTIYGKLAWISDGCGSFEVSWLRCEDMAVAVSGVVDAFVLAAEVEAPVVLEVAGGDEGAELEDGLGAFEAPSCARYAHPFQQSLSG